MDLRSINLFAHPSDSAEHIIGDAFIRLQFDFERLERRVVRHGNQSRPPGFSLSTNRLTDTPPSGCRTR